MLKLYAGIAVAAVAALIGGTAWYVLEKRSGDLYASCRQSTISGGAGSVGGPFTLIDQTGRSVTDKDVITKPTLVYFGYTFCPDVCPLDNARNAETVDILEERGYEVTPVFISIDPARDTPEVMGGYAETMHPRMIGLTGSAEQVAAAAAAYRTYYKAHDSGDEYYLVDHLTFTYLMDPKQGFLDFFRRELSADQMAEQVACFLDKG